jgi:hypothetical protein
VPEGSPNREHLIGVAIAEQLRMGEEELEKRLIDIEESFGAMMLSSTRAT